LGEAIHLLTAAQTTPTQQTLCASSALHSHLKAAYSDTFLPYLVMQCYILMAPTSSNIPHSLRNDGSP